MNEIGLVLKATEFAALRHKAQFRKGEELSPYINHPVQVSQSSDNAKKLKISDKIMNIRDVTNHPPNWWTLERILEYFD